MNNPQPFSLLLQLISKPNGSKSVFDGFFFQGCLNADRKQINLMRQPPSLFYFLTNFFFCVFFFGGGGCSGVLLLFHTPEEMKIYVRTYLKKGMLNAEIM